MNPDRSTALSGGRIGRDLLWLALGLAVLAAWEYGALDLPLSRRYGTASGFTWRDHWLTAGVIHQGLRDVGWLVFAWLVVGLWRPTGWLRRLPRPTRIWWAGTTALCAAVIPLVKRASSTTCPWSLAEFGDGVARYVPHWHLGLHDGGSGGCFPSGHASTAFAFLAGYFALRDHAPAAARRWLVGTLAVGAVLGWGQMARGAHYASHTLWTGWICWALSVASYHAVLAWRTRRVV